MCRGSLRSALVALLLLVFAAPAARADAGAITVLGTSQPSERVRVLHLSTPALAAPTDVRVLLPDGYDPSGATRYPVLYIVHGATQDSSRWLQLGDVEAATAGLPLIVVMPDGGPFGFYTDWWNLGAGGPPEWQTYHLDQLIPWIDANYPTVASRDGRAIAGESMGGLGAMHYAAVRPDLFTAAGSFSGAIDTNNLLAPPIIDATTLASAFGPRLTEEVRYRGHNPVDLAENLRGLMLQFDVGDGLAGGPVPALGIPGVPTDPTEYVMHQMAESMDRRLDSLGIAHGLHEFPGCHCWPQWQQDLREFLPMVMDRFAHPVAPPSPFSYTSISPRYGVWGWDVAIDRPALEFSHLFDAGPDGFGLTGSGRATVTTAPRFSPGESVGVTVVDARGTTAAVVVAGPDGRLTVPVSLGPGNLLQEYTLQGNVVAALNGGTWPSVTATVTFRRAAAPDAPPITTEVAAATPVAPPGGSLPTTGRSDAVAVVAGAGLVLALAARWRIRRHGWVTGSQAHRS